MGGKRTSGHYAGRMIAPRKSGTRPGRRWRDFAYALWLAPPTVLFPFVFLPFLMDFRSAMASIADAWEIYALFFAPPWALGIAVWAQGRRVDRRAAAGGT